MKTILLILAIVAWILVAVVLFPKYARSAVIGVVNTSTYSEQFAGHFPILQWARKPVKKPVVLAEADLDVREYLRSLTTPAEFVILDAIARCESKYRNVPNYLYDGEGGRFTAYGPFQILKSTAARYSTKDRRDPGTNVEIAVALYRARGSQPWYPSESCWGSADSSP